MDLISLVVVLIVVGVLLWLVNTYIPMDPKIKQVLHGRAHPTYIVRHNDRRAGHSLANHH